MDEERIYVLGAGSIGMALAVHLAQAGKKVLAVRTSAGAQALPTEQISVEGLDGRKVQAAIEMASLATLERIAGTMVIAAKSYANPAIAARLSHMEVSGPAVILQNGLGVEDPYLALESVRVYRCVIYATGRKLADNRYVFSPINPSPIGVVRGDGAELERLVRHLSTPAFPFHTLETIQQEVWKKAVINAVFNSICPLLEVDNGIFTRDSQVADLARTIIEEGCAVAGGMGYRLAPEEVMRQLLGISRGSDGQLISTLQDIRNGRETEIDALNLAIARLAGTLDPAVPAATTRLLGEMVKLKSALHRSSI